MLKGSQKKVGQKFLFIADIVKIDAVINYGYKDTDPARDDSSMTIK